ncbi:unnamed protein product [Aphanomyces euteiches]
MNNPTISHCVIQDVETVLYLHERDDVHRDIQVLLCRDTLANFQSGVIYFVSTQGEIEMCAGARSQAKMLKQASIELILERKGGVSSLSVATNVLKEMLGWSCSIPEQIVPAHR